MRFDAGTTLPAAGRIFFAVGLAGFGVLQFIYGDFVPGRAPAWPAAMPGRWIWAALSGSMLIASGAAIVSGIKARQAALLAGTLILLWALLRHLPEVVANPHGGVLTRTGKALALWGGAFAVAGSLPGAGQVNANAGLLALGRWCLGAFMILAGIQHFQFAEFVTTLVPEWIPGRLFWTYFAGIALIGGGTGLLLPTAARLAAPLSGLMMFLWVLLLHIPRATTAADAQLRNEWTAVFEALAMSGIAFVLAAPSPRVAVARIPRRQGAIQPD